jgi:hypothetical protein
MLMLLVGGSCGGDRAARKQRSEPPARQTYPASQEAVTAAAIEGLVKRGYLVEFVDRERGVIRTSQRITRDPEALVEGQRHRAELTLREKGPQETVVTVRPFFQRGVAGGLEWFDTERPPDLPDVERTIFQAIAAEL